MFIDIKPHCLWLTKKKWSVLFSWSFGYKRNYLGEIYNSIELYMLYNYVTICTLRFKFVRKFTLTVSLMEIITMFEVFNKTVEWLLTLEWESWGFI